jgi:trehalose 6-phosphate synthase/phosphatase
MNRTARLIVVSNRLPVTITCTGGEVQIQASSGGLVTALEPILESTTATWIGWTGTGYAPEVASGLAKLNTKYTLVPMYLSEMERERYYLGLANRVLWPLFHDMQTLCKFDSAFWPMYQSVNERFADEVTRIAKPGDFVWVHDYHLMLVAEHLRRRHLGIDLAYFHHIPFPAPDMFAKLPGGDAILSALLRFNRIGFQTENDKRNFIACARSLLRRKMTLHRMGPDLAVRVEGGCCVLNASAIGIDACYFQRLAKSAAVTARVRQLRASFGRRKIILGVDRLDYSKGIVERLAAFRTLLQQYPHLHGQLTLLQLVVPSREEVPEYEAMRLQIERSVAEINGTYGTPDWNPVIYLHRSVTCEELVSLYRIASVMLITSLKDGMNLVAKEYCASKMDEPGALVLSQFAGAAHELKVGAWLVNPYDVEAVVRACISALAMSDSEARSRMAAMQRVISRNNVWHWFASATGDNMAQSLPPEHQDLRLSSEAVA